MMRCLPGMYDIKLIDAYTKCVFNQHDADRALGRRGTKPEASYCLERVVDEGPRHRIDPIRLVWQFDLARHARTPIGTNL